MTRTPRILLILSSVWFIAAAALTTRVTFLWHQQHEIPHEILAQAPFDNEAGNIALALSQGLGFSNLFRQPTGPTAWLTPVYPLLLSLIFRVCGPFTFAAFIAATFLNTLLSGAVTFPLYALSQKIASRGIAIATSWLWAFLPAGILMPTVWIWDTSLSVLLATTLIWATLRISESANPKSWLAYSVLWTLALLTNPSLGIAAPFLFLWAAARAKAIAKLSARIPLLSFALILLFCAPWTIRNFSQFRRAIPLRSNFAFELWIGNNDIFDPHAIGGRQRITRYEETRRYAQLGETAYLDEKAALAKSFIRHHPALFLRLSARRVIATWSGTEHPIDDFLHTDSQLARLVILSNVLLTFGTLAGTWLLARSKNPFTFPVALFPVLYPLVYYFTHTSLRYRHPIDPLLLLLTVFAVTVSFSKLRRNSPTPPTTSPHRS